jgi:hypothetical protein
LTAAAALLRSSSSMLLGVRLYDSRVVAPPLLCSGQRCLLCFVSKWFVPGEVGAVRRPSSIWRRKMEDLIAFSFFPQCPLCLFPRPLCNFGIS